VNDTMSDNKQAVKDLITSIVSLSQGLPSSLPLAAHDNKIYRVISRPDGDNAWHTFNTRFDALFADDCRDSQGRLQYIHRGAYGMDAVCSYLNKLNLDDGDLPLNLLASKLERLNEELKFLM